MKDLKKVAFCSLGCKVNQYETNAMAQNFAQNGYEIVEFSEIADVYIVNTCTVTSIADKKSRQMLRRAKELNCDSIVVACGCYAQVAPEEILKIKEIDIVVGNNEKNKIIELLNDFMENRKTIESVSDVMYKTDYLEFGTTTYTEKTRAVIKVQDGCDRFCSYCLIPYARGHIRSRNTENVLQEVRDIVKKGFNEIVITGIHVASYGRDFKDGTTLIDLLEKIDKVEGLHRIRLSSIEPVIMTEDFIERLSKLNKICNHFHLSLQSGCTETLKRMNRRYTAEEFYEATERLKSKFPEALLTTDVIVGFPGETDEEFDETYKFLKKIKFYHTHVFKYSPRKGTKAAVMENQISSQIKEERSKTLLNLSNSNKLEYNKSFIGKTMKVLFEEREEEYYKGHTTNYMVVKYKTNEDLENKMLDIKIVSADVDFVYGEKA